MRLFHQCIETVHQHCPSCCHCGSKSVVPIVYGALRDVLIDTARIRCAELGTELSSQDRLLWHCHKCKRAFGSTDLLEIEAHRTLLMLLQRIAREMRHRDVREAEACSFVSMFDPVFEAGGEAVSIAVDMDSVTIEAVIMGRHMRLPEMDIDNVYAFASNVAELAHMSSNESSLHEVILTTFLGEYSVVEESKECGSRFLIRKL